jgi:hypothetical protein
VRHGLLLPEHMIDRGSAQTTLALAVYLSPSGSDGRFPVGFVQPFGVEAQFLGHPGQFPGGVGIGDGLGSRMAPGNGLFRPSVA